MGGLSGLGWVGVPEVCVTCRLEVESCGGGGWGIGIGECEVRYTSRPLLFFFLYEDNNGMKVSGTRGLFCFRLLLCLFCIETGCFV